MSMHGSTAEQGKRSFFEYDERQGTEAKTIRRGVHAHGH